MILGSFAEEDVKLYNTMEYICRFKSSSIHGLYMCVRNAYFDYILRRICAYIDVVCGIMGLGDSSNYIYIYVFT